MFNKIVTVDSTINRIQDNIKKAFAEQETFLSKAVLLEGIHLITGDNRINNPLSRKIKGIMVVLSSVVVNVYVIEDPMPEVFVNINASNDAVVNLVIF